MLNFASVINLFFLNKKSPEPLPVRCLFMHKLSVYITRIILFYQVFGMLSLNPCIECYAIVIYLLANAPLMAKRISICNECTIINIDMKTGTIG